MPNLVSFRVVVSDVTRLSQILKGIALRVPVFTVKDERTDACGGWAIYFKDIPKIHAIELCESLPRHICDIAAAEEVNHG